MSQKVLNPVWQKRIELEALVLSYRNTIQTVAQMRKAQQSYSRANNPTDPNFKSSNNVRQKFFVEMTRLEAAVDMRLSQLEIKAVQ